MWLTALIIPYMLHFGKVTQRHFWKKNPRLSFYLTMTSRIAIIKWRHVILKLHPRRYLYMLWRHTCDVTNRRYQGLKKNYTIFPGNDPASFLEKKSKPKIQNFFSINDAGLLPENHFLKNSLDFFPKMTLGDSPGFGFFFQDFYIRVNLKRETLILKIQTILKW